MLSGGLDGRLEAWDANKYFNTPLQETQVSKKMFCQIVFATDTATDTDQKRILSLLLLVKEVFLVILQLDSSFGGICAIEPLHTGHGDDVNVFLGVTNNDIVEGSLNSSFHPVVQV